MGGNYRSPEPKAGIRVLGRQLAMTDIKTKEGLART